MDIIAAAIAAESAAEAPAGIAGAVAVLGLNGKLFVAQLINFGLLVLILWRLLYKPLVGFMEDRSKRIAEGLAKASLYEEKLKKLELERQNVLAKADSESQKILVLADEEVKRISAAGKVEAERAAAETIARANREIEQAKKDMIGEVRRQSADLVILAAEKVIHKRLDEPADRQLIERALKEVG